MTNMLMLSTGYDENHMKKVTIFKVFGVYPLIHTLNKALV